MSTIPPNGSGPTPADLEILRQMNFTTDCTMAAEWIRNLAYLEPGINGTIDYIATAMRNVSGVASWGPLEILSWYYRMSQDTVLVPPEQLVTEFGQYAVTQPWQACKAEICHTFFRDADPDLSGIGMIITYYLEASLSTIFFLVLAWDRLWCTRHDASVLKARDDRFNLMASFRGAAKSFLDMATVFSLAMLLAAISTNAHSIYAEKRGRGSELNVYVNVLSVQLSIFSIFPTLLLQNIIRGLRRVWFRRLVMALIFCLAVVVVVLSEKTRPEGPGEHELWDQTCDEEQGKTILKWLMVVYAIFLTALAFWLICLHNVLRIPGLEDSPFLHHVADYWYMLVCTLSCAGMWVSLGLVTDYRDNLIEVARPDHHALPPHAVEYKDEDEEWRFGQYLALATFFPVFVDFGCIFIFGPRVGLEGRLSWPWRIFNEEQETTSRRPGLEGSSYALVGGEPSTPGQHVQV